MKLGGCRVRATPGWRSLALKIHFYSASQLILSSRGVCEAPIPAVPKCLIEWRKRQPGFSVLKNTFLWCKQVLM